MNENVIVQLSPTEKQISYALEYAQNCAQCLTGTPDPLGGNGSPGRNLSRQEQVTRDAALSCLYRYFNTAPEKPINVFVLSEEQAEQMDVPVLSRDELLERIKQAQGHG